MRKHKTLTATSFAAILLASAALSGTGAGRPAMIQEGDQLYLVETAASGEMIKQPAGSVWDGFVAASHRTTRAAELQAGTMIVEGDYAYLVETTSAGHTFKRRVAAVWDGKVAGLDRAPAQQQTRIETRDEG